MDVTEERADPERAWQPPAAQLPPVTEERDDGGDRPRRSDRRGRRKPGRGGVQLLSGLSGQRLPYPLAELTQRQPAVSGGALQRFHRRLPGPLRDGQYVLALDGLIPGVRSHAPSGARGGAAAVDVRWRADETSLVTGIPRGRPAFGREADWCGRRLPPAVVGVGSLPSRRLLPQRMFKDGFSSGAAGSALAYRDQRRWAYGRGSRRDDLVRR